MRATMFSCMILLLSSLWLKNVTPSRGQQFTHKYRNTWCLDRNSISSIEARVFAELSALEYLILKENRLTTLRKAMFSSLQNLIELNLKGNLISSIEDSPFAKLSALEILGLVENRLTALRKAMFSSLQNLEYLHSDGNPITEIESEAFNTNTRIFITLDENFLCCSRLHYENLNYKSGRCTYEGEIKEYNSFNKNYCNALKPPNPTYQSTFTPENTPTDQPSSSQSTQPSTPEIPLIPQYPVSGNIQDF
ncbi:relaxin receptor 2-like [Zophobas morio]|uniref:relaxin receptor 2-like n=1 Tax=Zophobas morio TaxID=2755281 RepID=UPI0030830919